MEREELIGRYMLPTRSDSEIPLLTRRERKQFVRAVEDLGIRAVFGAIINEALMRQRNGKLSTATLTRELGVQQRLINDPNVYAGPYVVRRSGRMKGRLYQIPGVVLYAVEDGSERS